MLQRIQTIWLVLTLGCIVAFIVLPFGEYIDPLPAGHELEASLHSWDFLGLIIPVGLAAVLSFIAIFTYKNLSLQKSCTVLTLAMVLIGIGITIYVLCDAATVGTFKWAWETSFIGGALLFAILALIGINHDIKLLRSYDRLR